MMIAGVISAVRACVFLLTAKLPSQAPSLVFSALLITTATSLNRTGAPVEALVETIMLR